MIVRLDGLRNGSHRQSWESTLDCVDMAHEDVDAAVGVNVQIHRLDDLITVRGDISAEMSRPCDRCLAPATVEIKAPLHVVIRQRSVSIETEEGDEGEFILTISDEAPEVDVVSLIRDRLAVEVPMVVHCGPDCKGLCLGCGANLNTDDCSCTTESDSRWNALRSNQADYK
jgi:uncharacterized protein